MRARQVKQTRYEAQLARIVLRTRQMNTAATPTARKCPGRPHLLGALELHVVSHAKATGNRRAADGARELQGRRVTKQLEAALYTMHC